MDPRKRKLSIRLHDTHIGIWQDDANDPSFRRDIFLKLAKQMRARGWTVAPDPHVLKNHRIISPHFKLANRGSMCASLKVSGRCCEVDYWSVAARRNNPNGPRYDFDKLERMPYLDRKRFLLERQKICAWLTSVADVTVARSTNRRDLPRAMDFIAAQYAESWHTDKDLGRPVCRQEGNARSADGGKLEHGGTVWFRGRDGRWRRGQALYHINNMWWVVENAYSWRNMACFKLHVSAPTNPREKRNDKARRAALEGELVKALKTSNDQRAAVIQAILFGSDAAHFIWSRKNSAYYRTNYSGYATDQMHAGRYTRAEAEAECKRVPHILEMVCPDGKHVRFDDTLTEKEMTS